MLDWYFFYHGLATQDWFRDARFIGDIQQPNKVYCSLNNIVTGKRSYRMALIARFMANDLCDFGDISFHADKLMCQTEIDQIDSHLSSADKWLITKTIIDGAASLPLIVDHAQVDGSFSARLGHQEYRLWQNSFVHVVNETVFYDHKLHLTEKIFKPIVALRPFLLVAAPGNLAYLQSYGFKTFDTWIDESYDKITDPDTRLHMILHEITRLCNLSPRQLSEMHQDMLPVLQHNKQHFFTAFRDQVVDELVDNFDACLRVWNNGRIDPCRSVPITHDSHQVKNLLKNSIIAGI